MVKILHCQCRGGTVSSPGWETKIHLLHGVAKKRRERNLLDRWKWLTAFTHTHTHTHTPCSRHIAMTDKTWKEWRDLNFKTSTPLWICWSYRAPGSEINLESRVEVRDLCLPGGEGSGTDFQLEAKDTLAPTSKLNKTIVNLLLGAIALWKAVCWGGGTKMLAVFRWELSLSTPCEWSGYSVTPYVSVIMKQSRTLWSLPPMSSACFLSVERLRQRVSLIREVRTCRNKGKQSKKTK